MTRRSLRARLMLLLAVVVGAVLLIAAAVMSQQTLGEGATRLARMVTAAVTALDRALPQNTGPAERASLARLVVQLSDHPPAHETPNALLGLEVLRRLQAERPTPDELRFASGPPVRLWFRSRTVPDLWIGLPLEHLRDPVARASVWILVLAGVVVWIAAGVLARQLLRPLERVAAAADAVLAGRPPAGLLDGASAEVARVVDALTVAATALHEQNTARERMLVGLSHDLRTPLARLRFALELGDEADPAQRTGMIADIDEMDALIGEALALARGGGDEARQSLDLVPLLRELAQRFGVQAEVRCAALPPSCVVLVQPLALRRALGNLVQNALRHGAPPVTLDLACSDTYVEVVVQDNGHGPDHADAGTRGFGIGLSVVRAVAAAHGGELVLRTLDSGFAAILRLPASVPAASRSR